MYDATHTCVGEADIFIAAAAVADYRPAECEEQKIKKNEESMSIELVRCPDILASVAALADAPFTVGFAAETEKVDDYARSKLEKKKLDMIVANRVGTIAASIATIMRSTSSGRMGNRRFHSRESRAGRDLVELIARHFYAARGTEPQPRLTVISNID